jgi:hypothetical protein
VGFQHLSEAVNKTANITWLHDPFTALVAKNQVVFGQLSNHLQTHHPCLELLCSSDHLRTSSQNLHVVTDHSHFAFMAAHHIKLTQHLSLRLLASALVLGF